MQEDENTTDDTKPTHRTQTLHVMLSHRLEEVDRAAQVVLVILQGLALRLSHVLESGKVNDGLNIGIGIEHLIKQPSLSHYHYTRIALRIRKIIQDSHFVATFDERNSRMRSDEAVSTSESLFLTISNQSREYSPSLLIKLWFP